MVVGIPNVGKSTFINAFAGKACAKTGNKPGVTKGKQWIKLNKNLELLDTPGILWPKFEDQAIGMKLAFIGSINDEILLTDELALDFIKHVENRYGHLIKERYSIENYGAPLEVLSGIAQNRRCFKKGEELDLEKAAGMLIDDFRSGKLGRISLEWPEEYTV
jgi:ribosome biogenesis GTPase A